jgi:hypothetical protein
MQSTEKKNRNIVNAYGTLDNKLSVGAVQAKQKILALKMPHRWIQEFSGTKKAVLIKYEGK